MPGRTRRRSWAVATATPRCSRPREAHVSPGSIRRRDFSRLQRRRAANARSMQPFSKVSPDAMPLAGRDRRRDRLRLRRDLHSRRRPPQPRKMRACHRTGRSRRALGVAAPGRSRGCVPPATRAVGASERHTPRQTASVRVARRVRAARPLRATRLHGVRNGCSAAVRVCVAQRHSPSAICSVIRAGSTPRECSTRAAIRGAARRDLAGVRRRQRGPECVPCDE